jgi:hypothetical protein
MNNTYSTFDTKFACNCTEFLSETNPQQNILAVMYACTRDERAGSVRRGP